MTSSDDMLITCRKHVVNMFLGCPLLIMMTCSLLAKYYLSVTCVLHADKTPPHVNGMQHVILYISSPFLLFLGHINSKLLLKNITRYFPVMKEKLSCKVRVTSQNYSDTWEEYQNPAPFSSPSSSYPSCS